ncbi:hypothetical protein [Rhodococcus sp. 1168]|uniref:hypothetical protein n=1 Tax=Rhodococcus sp. 1168 TaxID=2018041 RepID=UPI001592F5CF|nr:hypothetical protein [Rhodococcus sp. 1168]
MATQKGDRHQPVPLFQVTEVITRQSFVRYCYRYSDAASRLQAVAQAKLVEC